MKEEEINIRRLMQKCEEWLSDKIHNVTGDDKWWRLDQVLRAQTSWLVTHASFITYSTLPHWIVGLNNLKNQIGIL